MDKTVRIISSQPTPVLRNVEVQLSLANKEEIRMKNNEIIEKGARLVRNRVHVKLPEFSLAV